MKVVTILLQKDEAATKETLRTTMETSLVINKGAETNNLSPEIKELATSYGLTEQGLALFSAWVAHRKTGSVEAKAMVDGLEGCVGGIVTD